MPCGHKIPQPRRQIWGASSKVSQRNSSSLEPGNLGLLRDIISVHLLRNLMLKIEIREEGSVRFYFLTSV